MKKYFKMCGKNMNGIPVAFPEQEKDAKELEGELRHSNKVPYGFVLKDMVFKSKDIVYLDDLSNLKYVWIDNVPNLCSWMLISERLKLTLENFLTGEEGLVWLETHISALGETRKYFVPKFVEYLDVKSEFKGQAPIPYLCPFKIQKFNILHSSLKWEFPSSLVVSELVKKEVLKGKFIGINFENALVAPVE